MPHRPYAVSVKMLINEDGKWLFLKRTSDVAWCPELWDLPGGKMKPGETLQTALLREVFEETGLNVTIQKLFGAVEDQTPDFRLVHIIMMGIRVSGELELSDEHIEYKWLEPTEIDQIRVCDYLDKLQKDGKF